MALAASNRPRLTMVISHGSRQRPIRALEKVLAVLVALSFGAVSNAQPRPTETVAPTRVMSARLLWARGSVEVSAPIARPVQEGEVLTPGMRLRVGDDSAAALLFDGGVTIALDANSQITLFAPPQGSVGPAITVLHNGTVRVKVSPEALASREETLPVSTRALTAWLGRANAVLSADLGGHITRVAVHDGRVRVRASDREYLVPAGMGSLEEENRPARPLRPLPKAPEWRGDLPDRLLSWGEPVETSVSWSAGRRQNRRYPVHAWRIELSRDATFRDPGSIARLSASDHRWRARGMTPGVWYLRAFALDIDRFESVPSVIARVSVSAPRVIPGRVGHRAAFEIPEGFFCSIDSAPFMPSAFPVALSPARDHSVRCSLRADGHAARERIVPASASGPLLHTVRVTTPVASSDGQSVRAVVSVDLRDAENHPVSLANITATTPVGISVDPLRETTQRGVYTAALTAPSTTRQILLRFTVNNVSTFDIASGLRLASHPTHLTGTELRAPRRIEVQRVPVFRPEDDDSALPDDE